MKQTLKPVIVLMLLCAFISPSKILAQVPDTSTMQKLLQYISQPVNKTQVPAGIITLYYTSC